MRKKIKYPVVESRIRASGMSMTDVAKAIGVPATTLYDRMSGVTYMTLDVALAIKELLGAEESIDELFAGHGPAA